MALAVLQQQESQRGLWALRSPMPVRAKLVTFSGVDGAGKSTQIKALQACLRDLGLSSTVYIFWDDVAAFPGLRERMSHSIFKGDSGTGSPAHPIRRRDKNVNSWYITLVRFFLYTLDVLSLHFAISSLNPRTDVVIFDRYIYDELANLPLRNRATRFVVRILLSLGPRPDVALLLDADPEIAATRKPEYPLEFVRRNRDSYLRLSHVAGMTVLPPLPIEQAAAEIRKSVVEKCLQRRAASPSHSLRQPVITEDGSNASRRSRRFSA